MALNTVLCSKGVEIEKSINLSIKLHQVVSLVAICMNGVEELHIL